MTATDVLTAGTPALGLVAVSPHDGAVLVPI